LPAGSLPRTLATTTASHEGAADALGGAQLEDALTGLQVAADSAQREPARVAVAGAAQASLQVTASRTLIESVNAGVRVRVACAGPARATTAAVVSVASSRLETMPDLTWARRNWKCEPR
jgi:hypothetical protein